MHCKPPLHSHSAIQKRCQLIVPLPVPLVVILFISFNIFTLFIFSCVSSFCTVARHLIARAVCPFIFSSASLEMRFCVCFCAVRMWTYHVSIITPFLMRQACCTLCRGGASGCCAEFCTANFTTCPFVFCRAAAACTAQQ